MKRVMVFIEEVTHKGLKIEAARRGLPMRNLVRNILEKWIKDGDRVAPEGR